MPFTNPSDRSAWRARRANQLRADLIAWLGGVCEHCGATHDLEINHKEPRDWQPRKLTHYRRVLRYWREAREGRVNVLCASCNSVYRPVPAEERAEGPF